jgi:hypothetical protein
MIGGVMISVLASSAVERRFENRSGQTKDYETGMCYFSAKHPALRRKSKDWLARNQNNVFKNIILYFDRNYIYWKNSFNFYGYRLSEWLIID